MILNLLMAAMVAGGVAAATNSFVAVGNSGNLRTSPDIVTWTGQDGKFSGGHINAIAFGNGSFVAVGNDGKISTSPDCTNWTAKSSTLGSGHHFTTVVFADNRFLAGTVTGKIVVSDDNGASWGLLVNGPSNGWTDSHYANGTIVFAGGVGLLYVSTNNGANWTQYTGLFYNENVTSIHYAAGKWLAGCSGSRLFTTANILTASTTDQWAQRISSAGTGQGGYSFKGIASNGNVVMTVLGNRYYRSADGGITWDWVATAAQMMNRIRYLNTKFVSVGNNGQMQSSSDNGNNWDGRAPGFATNVINDVIYH